MSWLSNEEKIRIRELRKEGLSTREIADQIGRHPCTVNRAVPLPKPEIKICALSDCDNEFEPRKCAAPQIYCCIKHKNRAGDRSQRKRDYRKTHKEQIRKSQRASYQRNRETQLEYGRDQYKSNCHDELTYLMWSPGLDSYKIGKTVNLSHRYSTIRTGCWDVELVTTFPHGRKLERWLHKYFKATRIPGTEWFTGNLTEVDVKSAVIEYENTRKKK